MKLLRIAILLLMAAASVCAQPTPIKVGHGLSPASHMGSAGAAFAETLSAKAPGKFKVELFPSFALGDERQMVEGAILGNIDFVITSTGPMGNFAPDLLVLDLPFLFRDYAHARKVLDGPIGEKLLEKCASRGFACLAWSENGFRHLTNSKRTVSTPDDLKGLKIRTMENDVHMQAFKTLGAMPTPISGSEIYSALQQKAVDGAENPLGNIGLQKLQ
jgi:tripartite ATP-independent transporter DctP family solute receptor